MTISLGDAVTTKGAKLIPLDKPLEWCLDPMGVMYEPSSFDTQSTRKTICMQPTTGVAEKLREFEEQLTLCLTKESKRLFGSEMTAEEVSARFMSTVRTQKKGGKALRLKLNTAGKYAVKCWDPEKQKMEIPEEWRQYSVQPFVRVKSLWMVGKEFGPILEMEHALLTEGEQTVAACPF